MILRFLEFFPVAQETLLIGFFVFLRIGAAMAFLPAFGEQMVPMRIRLAATIAFTTVTAPAIAPDYNVPAVGSQIAGFALVEVASGLVIGVVLRFFVHALQIAGSIAAQSTSLSQILGNAAAEPMPAIGQVLLVGGLTLAVVLGLHIRLAEYLILSYQLFPPGAHFDVAAVSTWGIARVAHAFSLAFSLSAPFVIASFLYNLALGVINRAMPQLMVAFVGAPAITFGGLALLFLTAPLIFSIWTIAFHEFLSQPGRAN